MTGIPRALTAAFVAVAFVPGVALGQPLPTDPSLVMGRLDNGLKYVVRQHAVPPGRATVWVRMDTGSLNETDRQRGIAHYLEHMAFNGSENFPPGSVVPYFQSLGMTFGRDQNAYTNMQETVYQLSLPDTKPQTLNRGMTFFADIVGRLSLLPKEIDAERQIIQEERRRNLSGRQRTGYYVIERMTPGSIFGQRMTIGTEETIDGVNQADFRDYYGKWYGASNATLMVVADADPAVVVKEIKEIFGGLPAKDKVKAQELGVRAYDTSFAIVASDPEVRTASVRITRLEPVRPATTTVPQYRDDLVRILGQSAMNRRMRDRVDAGGTAFQTMSVSAGNESGAIYTAEASVSATPEQWRAALDEMALELQRAREFGFSEREIADAKKQIMSGAERAVETDSTMEARGLIARINADLGDGEPTVSPAQRLELVQKLLPTITKNDIDARFAREFDPAAVAFVAVMPSGPGVPTEAELLELGTKALAAKPTPLAETKRATTLMEELPKAGSFVELAEHTSTRVWSGWLSNNVRVHYRFMEDRKNNASVHIALYGGEILETAKNRGITAAAQLAWATPATGTLTSADIREIMTGSKVNVRGGGFFGGRGGGRRGGGGGGGGDSIDLTIGGSPDEFETGFQLAYLLLTDPRIEAPAFERYQTTVPLFLQEAMKTPDGVFARTVMAAPFPDDDARARMVTPEQIKAMRLADAQAWLNKMIAESPIEVTIVGDIPKDRAIDLAARYLGALPARERVTTDLYRSQRTLQRPKGPRGFEETVVTETPQAQVYSGFYGPDESNLADTRAMSMASRIISTRMTTEIREEAQLVYSIGASSRPGTTYPGFGQFAASAPTDPAKTDALVAKVASMYAAFAEGGPTAEELSVAKKQRANDIDEQMRNPQFWSGQLQSMTLRGTSLDDVVGMAAAYEAMTAEQIKSTFAKYYSPQNAVVVVVKPAPKPAQ